MHTSGLVYADIGQATFNQQRHLLPGIPNLDDTPVEYAQINVNSLAEKPSMPQPPVEANGKYKHASTKLICTHLLYLLL